jgi:serine/threonine-protein kinase
MPAECPSCSDTVSEAARFCPGCGTALDVSATPTGTAPRSGSRTPSGEAQRTPVAGSRPPSSGSSSRAAAPTIDGGRFLPGTLLLDRYRVVELLGRGGMGEVYRAEDLMLGQSVALKFLPADLRSDPERLARFYNEVRMAREVTHASVCRVHDVAEADGQPFLSMEYVDGEDLTSLLRKIGRLPADKAIDIARQLCAGVAAAHEKGVVHRDLKPQNVMLDSRGRVRIADFGLAGLAGSIQGDDVLSGTPGYMSPEQLSGQEVTRRSDIHAIGLILYELFTGKRAYPGRGYKEVRRQHGEPLPTPSSLVPDLEPSVETAILRCLEDDPARRPASALAVSQLLPGGDPLAAALAAGETPSPEMVAAAGRADQLRPAMGWACLGLIAFSFVVVPVVGKPNHLFSWLPDVRAPVVLEDRASEFLKSVADIDPPADRARGFQYHDGYFRWAMTRDQSPRRWEQLRTGEPEVVSFWYRQSPRPLAPDSGAAVRWWDPPAIVSGMAGVRVDLSGRLLSFYVVPPQLEKERGAPREPDWGPLFAAARLDPARFTRVESKWTPPFYCDVRAAWEGVFPQRPEIPLRIEAAAYRGRPTYFEMMTPWSEPYREQAWRPTRMQNANNILVAVLQVVLVIVGGWLARRNLGLGRGDRRGAARLGFSLFALGLLVWVLEAHHVADRQEMALMAREAGSALLFAGVMWLFYLALEPYVRRFWPTTLISWTRLLTNGPNDPLIGRDILFGMSWGAAIALLFVVPQLALKGIGPQPTPHVGRLGGTLSLQAAGAALLSLLFNGLVLAMGSLLLMLLLKLLLKREWLAACLLVGVLTLLQALGMGGDTRLWWSVPMSLVIMGSFVWLLMRAGLVACILGVVAANLLGSFPLTLDFGDWHGGLSAMIFVSSALLTAFAFRAAVHGTSQTARPKA